MANERIEHDANQSEHSLGHQHDGKAAQPWEIPAPDGRPDTTAPLGSASLAADAHRLSGERAQPRVGLRRGSPAATAGHADALCGRALPAEGLTLINGSSGAVCMACMDGIPSGSSGPRGTPMSSPVPGPPLISADAAAKALQEYFLANADRGGDDELVAEMLRRIRARQAAPEGGC